MKKDHWPPGTLVKVSRLFLQHFSTEYWAEKYKRGIFKVLPKSNETIHYETIVAPSGRYDEGFMEATKQYFDLAMPDIYEEE